MQTVTLRSHVGAAGISKLQIPVELREVDMEVVVVVQPMNKNGVTQARKAQLAAGVS